MPLQNAAVATFTDKDDVAGIEHASRMHQGAEDHAGAKDKNSDRSVDMVTKVIHNGSSLISRA
jgi:hypothetical protein